MTERRRKVKTLTAIMTVLVCILPGVGVAAEKVVVDNIKTRLV